MGRVPPDAPDALDAPDTGVPEALRRARAAPRHEPADGRASGRRRLKQRANGRPPTRGRRRV